VSTMRQGMSICWSLMLTMDDSQELPCQHWQGCEVRDYRRQEHSWSLWHAISASSDAAGVYFCGALPDSADSAMARRPVIESTWMRKKRGIIESPPNLN